MITTLATSIGIDKILFTWNDAYVITLFCFCFGYAALIGTRLHYIIKRQPVYKLINEPRLIKETFRDCLNGKLLPNSNPTVLKTLSLLVVLYGIILLTLLAIKWIAMSHGMALDEIKMMTIPELLKNL